MLARGRHPGRGLRIGCRRLGGLRDLRARLLAKRLHGADAALRIARASRVHHPLDVLDGGGDLPAERRHPLQRALGCVLRLPPLQQR